jgi:hypothetical protein
MAFRLCEIIQSKNVDSLSKKAWLRYFSCESQQLARGPLFRNRVGQNVIVLAKKIHRNATVI